MPLISRNCIHMYCEGVTGTAHFKFIFNAGATIFVHLQPGKNTELYPIFSSVIFKSKIYF